jgi:hypothetical protein
MEVLWNSGAACFNTDPDPGWVRKEGAGFTTQGSTMTQALLRRIPFVLAAVMSAAGLSAVAPVQAADSISLQPGMWESVTRYWIGDRALPVLTTPAACLAPQDATLRPADMLRTMMEQNAPWHCDVQQQALDGAHYSAQFHCTTDLGGRFNGQVQAQIHADHFQGQIHGRVTPVDGRSGRVLSTTELETRGEYSGHRLGPCTP